MDSIILFPLPGNPYNFFMLRRKSLQSPYGWYYNFGADNSSKMKEMKILAILITVASRHLFSMGIPLLSSVPSGVRAWQEIFNGQGWFILKFFVGLVFVFLIGGLIGKLLHLERAFHSDHDTNSW